MPHPYSLVLQPKQAQNLKQLQRLIMSPQMQQAFHLLQLPVLELTTIIEAELEQNPVLENDDDNPEEDQELEALEEESAEESEDKDNPAERSLSFDERDFEVLKHLDEEFRDLYSESGTSNAGVTAEDEKHRTYNEESIRAAPGLFEHLMKQALDTFESPQDLRIAEEIIGNLDSSGFFKTSLEEMAALNDFELSDIKRVLEQIQTFHPNGVGAVSIRESLLIQLCSLGKKKTLAYKIIEKYFDHLLHNHIPLIKKGLGCTAEEIAAAIEKDIARLDLHPGALFSQNIVQSLVPDLSIVEEGDELKVVINDDTIPSLRLNRRYLRMLEDETLPLEAKEFIRNKIMSAKWLLRNIHQRNETLEKIALTLIRRQAHFFKEPDGKLTPLIMQEVADEIEMHESTIARAVANKCLNCPRGIFPLRYFFTNAYETEQGDEISSKTVKEVLQDTIEGENKLKPLTDELLSKLLKDKGIPCARRTIAKYRGELNIGNVNQRRKFE